MASSRTKKTTIADVTLDQAQAASRQYSTASIALDKVEAKMNEEINKIKSKYEPEINQHREAMESPVGILEQYAKQEKDNWEKKSMELLNCVIGFRTGTGKVDKESGFTWDAVKQLLNGTKLLKQFIVTKTDIDKQAILKVTDEKVLKSLRANGKVFITKEETFFVDVKKEDVKS